MTKQLSPVARPKIPPLIKLAKVQWNASRDPETQLSWDELSEFDQEHLLQAMRQAVTVALATWVPGKVVSADAWRWCVEQILLGEEGNGKEVEEEPDNVVALDGRPRYVER